MHGKKLTLNYGVKVLSNQYLDVYMHTKHRSILMTLGYKIGIHPNGILSQFTYTEIKQVVPLKILDSSQSFQSE